MIPSNTHVYVVISSHNGSIRITNSFRYRFFTVLLSRLECLIVKRHTVLKLFNHLIHYPISTSSAVHRGPACNCLRLLLFHQHFCIIITKWSYNVKF